jgi:hypothetical protein
VALDANLICEHVGFYDREDVLVLLLRNRACLV